MPTAVLRSTASDAYGKTESIKTVGDPLSSASDSIFAKPTGVPVESVYTTTASSTTALAANTGRKGLFIKNISDTDITLRFDGSVVVASSGIVLKALGTTGDTISSDMLGFVPTGAITAINGTGSKNIYIVVLN